MAVAVTRLDEPSQDLVVVQVADLENTGVNNVLPGTGKVYLIVADNSANAAEVNYLKLYDLVAPVYGTTEPDYCFELPAGAIVPIPLRLPTGVNFAAALSMACANEAGANCTTIPTAAVNVTIYAVPD